MSVTSEGLTDSILANARAANCLLDDLRSPSTDLKSVLGALLPAAQKDVSALTAWSSVNAAACEVARTIAMRAQGMRVDVSRKYLAQRATSLMGRLQTNAGLGSTPLRVEVGKVDVISDHDDAAVRCDRFGVEQVAVRAEAKVTGGALGNDGLPVVVHFAIRQSYAEKTDFPNAALVGLALARPVRLTTQSGSPEPNEGLRKAIEEALSAELAKTLKEAYEKIPFEETPAVNGWKTIHEAGYINSYATVGNDLYVGLRLHSYGAQFKASGDLAQIEPVYGLSGVGDPKGPDFTPTVSRPAWAHAAIHIHLGQFATIISTEITRLMLAKQLSGAKTTYSGFVNDPRPEKAGKRVMHWVGMWPLRYSNCTDFRLISCDSWKCEFGKCLRSEAATFGATISSVGEFLISEGALDKDGQRIKVPILLFRVTPLLDPTKSQNIPFSLGGPARRIEMSLTEQTASFFVEYLE